MFEYGLKITEGAFSFAKDRLEKAVKAHQSALSSVGYNLMRLMKFGVDIQAPGMVSWPPRSPLSATPVLSGGYQKKPNWPQLQRTIKYKKIATNAAGQFSVKVGFLSPGAAVLASRHAQDQVVPVTERMRRKFWATGHFMAKETTRILIPKREVVPPVFRQNQGKVLGYVQGRIWAALAGKDPKSISF